MARPQNPTEARVPTPRRGKRAPRGQMLVFAVFALPALALLLPTCLVIACAMVPSMIASFVSRQGRSYLAATVAMPNLCGSLPLITELWTGGQSYGAAIDVLADGTGLLAAYGAAGIGWMIFISLSSVVRSYYAMAADARIRNLARLQRALVQAWGEDVTGGQEWSDADTGEPARLPANQSPQ